MQIEDDEILQGFIEESLEHLADIETDLLAIEKAGANIDENLVNKVFRAAHSIKGGAGFMGLTVIQELSHAMENILGRRRCHPGTSATSGGGTRYSGGTGSTHTNCSKTRTNSSPYFSNANINCSSYNISAPSG